MLLGLFLIFLLWFTYERIKADRHSSYSNEEFWERERRASFTPSARTDNLPYIKLDESAIPSVTEGDSEELKSVLEEIRSLKDTQMIDLSEMTNTELKLKYGTANFTALSEADQRFALLITDFEKAGELLAAAGRRDEAYALVSYAAELSGYSRLRRKAEEILTAPAEDTSSDTDPGTDSECP
ncbi:MAG: hypothetical protein IJL07_03845 [Lachnospiraceae bacterium]|nr:hypothetical protein [Lachnospiraceae bacterium]MBQ6090383.1 hypothetical protein [Lachnospiraceae bacterium]